MVVNKCKGCIYDSADGVAPEKVIKNLVDYCAHCKRAIREEYQDSFEDLYTGKLGE